MGHGGIGMGSSMGGGGSHGGHFGMGGLNASPEVSRATASGPYWQQQLIRADVSFESRLVGLVAGFAHESVNGCRLVDNPRQLITVLEHQL